MCPVAMSCIQELESELSTDKNLDSLYSFGFHLQAVTGLDHNLKVIILLKGSLIYV